MRVPTYSSMTDAWLNAAHSLVTEGQEVQSRNGRAVELLGASFRLRDLSMPWVGPPRDPSRSYAAGELLWYLSGSDDGDHIRAYAPSYAAFLEPSGHAYGAYGKRWRDYNQLECAYDLMRRDPQTRQCVVSCWHPSDLAASAPGKVKDVPCTTALNFQPRGGVLNLVVTMRSNDWWLGMPYDAWCFMAVQRLMAAALKMRTGFYQHQVGSLHAYEPRFAELSKAAEMATRGNGVEQDRPWNVDAGCHGHTERIKCWGDLAQQVSIAVLEERRIRLNEGGPRGVQPAVLAALGGAGSLLGSALLDAAKKLTKGAACSGQ